MAVKDREPAERKETPAEEIREGIMGFTNTDRGKARSSFSIEKEMRPEGAFVREACVNSQDRIPYIETGFMKPARTARNAILAQTRI